ncbi:hypothetical protein M0811_12249 [Anaeramoeba ignava]|uniref:Uncharacterized protein n=1 Tax=Anaeramoeba ignava TaxID=1746090 RepID=A0A9Q0L8K0_ANAIG|nr:hypothetical protein M0811_12249 [Anaeramoeba ignava]
MQGNKQYFDVHVFLYADFEKIKQKLQEQMMNEMKKNKKLKGKFEFEKIKVDSDSKMKNKKIEKIGNFQNLWRISFNKKKNKDKTFSFYFFNETLKDFKIEDKNLITIEKKEDSNSEYVFSIFKFDFWFNSFINIPLDDEKIDGSLERWKKMEIDLLSPIQKVQKDFLQAFLDFFDKNKEKEKHSTQFKLKEIIKVVTNISKLSNQYEKNKLQFISQFFENPNLLQSVSDINYPIIFRIFMIYYFNYCKNEDLKKVLVPIQFIQEKKVDFLKNFSEILTIESQQDQYLQSTFLQGIYQLLSEKSNQDQYHLLHFYPIYLKFNLTYFPISPPKSGNEESIQSFIRYFIEMLDNITSNSFFKLSFQNDIFNNFLITNELKFHFFFDLQNNYLILQKIFEDLGQQSIYSLISHIKTTQIKKWVEVWNAFSNNCEQYFEKKKKEVEEMRQNGNLDYNKEKYIFDRSKFENLISSNFKFQEFHKINPNQMLQEIAKQKIFNINFSNPKIQEPINQFVAQIFDAIKIDSIINDYKIISNIPVYPFQIQFFENKLKIQEKENQNKDFFILVKNLNETEFEMLIKTLKWFNNLQKTNQKIEQESNQFYLELENWKRQISEKSQLLNNPEKKNYLKIFSSIFLTKEENNQIKEIENVLSQIEKEKYVQDDKIQNFHKLSEIDEIFKPLNLNFNDLEFFEKLEQSYIFLKIWNREKINFFKKEKRENLLKEIQEELIPKVKKEWDDLRYRIGKKTINFEELNQFFSNDLKDEDLKSEIKKLNKAFFSGSAKINIDQNKIRDYRKIIRNTETYSSFQHFCNQFEFQEEPKFYQPTFQKKQKLSQASDILKTTLKTSNKLTTQILNFIGEIMPKRGIQYEKEKTKRTFLFFKKKRKIIKFDTEILDWLKEQTNNDEFQKIIESISSGNSKLSITAQLLNSLRNRMTKYLYYEKKFTNIEQFLDLINESERDFQKNQKERAFDFAFLHKTFHEFIQTLKMNKKSIQQQAVERITKMFSKGCKFIFEFKQKIETENEIENENEIFLCEIEDDSIDLKSLYEIYYIFQDFRRKEEIEQSNSFLTKTSNLLFQDENIQNYILQFQRIFPIIETLPHLFHKLLNYLEKWEKEIEKAYKKYPSISFFSQEQFFSILHHFYLKQEIEEIIPLLHLFNPKLETEKLKELSLINEENIVDFTSKLLQLFPIQNSIQNRLICIRKKPQNYQEKQEQLKNQFNEILEKREGTIIDPKIYIYRFNDEEQIYDITTTLYLCYFEHFPLKENVLICSKKTKERDILNFLSIYKIYNTDQTISHIFSNEKEKNPRNFLFTILYPQELKTSINNFLIEQIQRINYKTKFPLVLLCSGDLYQVINLIHAFKDGEIKEKLEILERKGIQEIFENNYPNYSNYQTFTSKISGLGKTYQIRNIFIKQKEMGKKYFYISLKNGTKTETIKKIQDIYQKEYFKKTTKKYYFHIEFPFSSNRETKDFIWEFLMWKSIENRRKISTNGNELVINFQPQFEFSFEIPSSRAYNSENGLRFFPSLRYMKENECIFDDDVFSFEKYKISNENENRNENENDIELEIDLNLKRVARLIELSQDTFQYFQMAEEKEDHERKRKELLDNIEPDKQMLMKETFINLYKKIIISFNYLNMNFLI